MTRQPSEHLDAELLSSYALEALSPQEARAVAAHLAECSSCRDELRAWREVTASLATLAPDAAAPAGMRERVLARAASERQPGQATSTASASATRTSSARPSRVPSRWPLLLAAASVLLAVGLSASYLNLRADRATLESRLAAAESRARDLALGLAERDSLIQRVLRPDVQIATLAATGEAPSVRLFWNRGRGEMIVSAKRLAPAAEGQVYQLWGIAANSNPVGLGTFNTTADGNALLVLSVQSAGEYDVSAVTLEPAPGSPGPTTTPILVGRWPGDPIQSRD